MDHRRESDSRLRPGVRAPRASLLGLAACLLVTAALLSPEGSARGGKKQADQQEATPVYYPSPPQQPRLQFLRTLSKQSDMGASKKGKFQRFVLGDQEQEEEIQRPYGMATHDGKLYVADSAGLVVWIFDLDRKSVTKAGQDGRGRLQKPINIAVDGEGVLYVADTGLKQIVAFGSDGKYLRAYGDPETMEPTDVDVYEDTLYCCDIANGQVVVLDKKSGEEVRRFGRKGSADGELFFPTNVAVDGDGNAAVADTGNARIMYFDRRGNFLRQLGQLDMAIGNFVRPKGVGFDRDHRIYVADAASEHVQIFDNKGRLLLFFGGPGTDPGSMSLPAGVHVDYDCAKYFQDFAAPGHTIEYLVFVSNQYSAAKVNVYGFLKADE